MLATMVWKELMHSMHQIIFQTTSILLSCWILKFVVPLIDANYNSYVGIL